MGEHPESGRCAVVFGVGPENGLGGALARRFSRELNVFIVDRSRAKLEANANRINESGGQATLIVADAADEACVNGIFRTIEALGMTPELAISTVDHNQMAAITDTGAELFEILWRQNTYAGFLIGRAAARVMLKHNRGTIIFTGASASLRARPPFTAFASGKFALRGLAQGMARELGPQGIHVAHLIIDGVLDGERARTQFPQIVAQKGEAGLMNLDDVTNVYWTIYKQPKSTWTHELDIRPFKESF